MIAFGKMLRHQDENPFATLLTMTRTSVVCPSTYGIPESLQSELTLEKRNVYMKIGAALDEYAPPMHVHGEKKTKDVVRRKLGLLMWRNWDRFSARWVKETASFLFACLFVFFTLSSTVFRFTDLSCPLMRALLVRQLPGFDGSSWHRQVTS